MELDGKGCVGRLGGEERVLHRCGVCRVVSSVVGADMNSQTNGELELEVKDAVLVGTVGLWEAVGRRGEDRAMNEAR